MVRARVLKLVAQLVPYLPQNKKYRLVFMERDLDEVLRSQRVMLDRHARGGAALDPAKLKAVYERQLALVDETIAQFHLPVLRVPHFNAIKDPSGTAHRLADFLGLPLDLPAMATVIDPKLHRQRA